MLKLLGRIERTLSPVSVWIGRIIPWLMPVLVAVTFSVVVLRYSFNYGTVWMQESITYLHAFILMLCMGYTQHCDEHVRVDIFYSRLSVKKRRLINLLGNIVLLVPLSITILISSFGYALRSWLVLEGSIEVGGLPLVFILKSLIPLMALLLLVQSIVDITKNLRAMSTTD